MRLIRIHRHEYGPRVYVAGRRLHHGSAAIGVALTCRAIGHSRLSYLALAVAVHDIRDFPFRDIDNHAPRRRLGA